MLIPERPKIYHIVHEDRLPSIVQDGYLWCDAEVLRRQCGGSTIGMSTIKKRRLQRSLTSHPGLHVGDCVPFYFCPRSVMLYVIHRANHPELTYRKGQRPIVHLEADLHRTVEWAESNSKRWAFTLTNAGSNWFDDRVSLSQLDDLNWDAIQSNDFSNPDMKEGKQAEFLIDHCFPWTLVERIGVLSLTIATMVLKKIAGGNSPPPVEIRPEWYYVDEKGSHHGS